MRQSCSLGDAITLKRGYDLPHQMRQEGSVPIVSSAGVTGTHSEHKVRGPGVVTGRYGTLGEVHYVKQDFWPLNTTLYVQDFKGNNVRFISYLLQTLDFGSRSGAAAVPGVNRNDLHRLLIELPDLPTQRRIASILSAYDDLIENNTRRIAILEEMARRVYEEWFVHFRFPGHEQMKMVESEQGAIPEGWAVTNLDSVSDYINRGLTPKYDDSAEGIVINQKCIRGQKLSYEPTRRQSKPIPAEKRVRYGDVLINSTGVGTLGRVAQVLEERSNCTVDTHVTIVRPMAQIKPHFFGLSLLALEQHFEQQGVGATGQTELGRGRVAETAFMLPPDLLQVQFDELVAPMRRLATKLAAKNSNLRTTRDLLLPKLISGELDVSTVLAPEEAIAA